MKIKLKKFYFYEVRQLRTRDDITKLLARIRKRQLHEFYDFYNYANRKEGPVVATGAKAQFPMKRTREEWEATFARYLTAMIKLEGENA